jgi:hypothetical protein
LLSQPPEKPKAALLQEKALMQRASLKRALAAMPALVVQPESPRAAPRVSRLLVLERLPVLLAPRAEPAQALRELPQAPHVSFLRDSAQHPREGRLAEMLLEPQELGESVTPVVVVEEQPRQPASCVPLWPLHLSRLYPKPLFLRRRIPRQRARGNVREP